MGYCVSRQASFPFFRCFPSFQTIILSNMNTNTMFQIINEHEVRLMGRKYLYKGENLFHVQDRAEVEGEAWSFDAWQGASVENPAVLKQFKVLREQDGWMDNILNMVSDKREVVMDRWEYAIRSAVKQFPDGFKLQQLVYPVCIQLGSTEDEAIAGISYHPYNGKQINVQGWIATWIEERSPDSRQRYFVAGRRYNSTKPLLFTNDRLYEANASKEWRPYSHVRGGLWQMDSAAAEARAQPEEEILNAAALLYKKQGMRGAKNRTAVTQDLAGTERVPNVAGIAAGFMATLGIVAALAPNNA